MIRIWVDDEYGYKTHLMYFLGTKKKLVERFLNGESPRDLACHAEELEWTDQTAPVFRKHWKRYHAGFVTTVMFTSVDNYGVVLEVDGKCYAMWPEPHEIVEGEGDWWTQGWVEVRDRLDAGLPVEDDWHNNTRQKGEVSASSENEPSP